MKPQAASIQRGGGTGPKKPQQPDQSNKVLIPADDLKLRSSE